MDEPTLLSGSTRILRESLSGLSRRQQLIANNLANVDTPGYRAYDVPFERALDREVRKTEQFSLLVTSPGHLSASESSLEQALMVERQPAFRGDGNGVDVDSEMSKLSQTAIEYNVVVQLLQGRLAQLRSAVSDGRR